MQDFLSYRDDRNILKRNQIKDLDFGAPDLNNRVIDETNLHNNQEQKKGHHDQALCEMTLVDDGDRVGSLKSDDYEGAMHNTIDQMYQHVSPHKDAVLFVCLVDVAPHFSESLTKKFFLLRR